MKAYARLQGCRQESGEHCLMLEEKFLSWPISVAWGLCSEWKAIVLVPYWTKCLFCIYLVIRLRRRDALTTHNKKGHRNKSGFLRVWPIWLGVMANSEKISRGELWFLENPWSRWISLRVYYSAFKAKLCWYSLKHANSVFLEIKLLKIKSAWIANINLLVINYINFLYKRNLRVKSENFLLTYKFKFLPTAFKM